MYNFDKEFNRQGYSDIAGLDEAGRGPLAGPVCASAVILDLDKPIEGLNDSKKLTEKKRELLFEEIIKKAKCYCIAWASVEEIDEINILQASLLAMRRAVDGLSLKPDLLIIDGNADIKHTITSELVVKGDAKSASIAAASILAKVSRDRLVTELAKTYPQYYFEKHKGYGTKLHYEKLDEFGPCEIHRKTFLKKWEAQSENKPKNWK